MLRRREVIIWSTLALIIVWPLTLWGADREIQEPKTPIARLEVQPARIDWLPQVDDERLVLTVAGPGDLYIHQEFRRPQDPFLKITSPQDEGLPDGNYSYELRIVPHAALETMAQEQRIGVESIIGSLPRTKNIPESQPVQWGFFSIQEGAFVASSEQHDQLPDVTKHRVTGIASPDQVINDNLIVIGQACIGPACSAGLPGYDVVIKDTTPSIRLVDTTICCSNDDDWVIHTNFGGADNFVILNENTSGTDTKPFIIGAASILIQDDKVIGTAEICMNDPVIIIGAADSSIYKPNGGSRVLDYNVIARKASGAGWSNTCLADHDQVVIDDLVWRCDARYPVFGYIWELIMLLT